MFIYNKEAIKEGCSQYYYVYKEFFEPNIIINKIAILSHKKNMLLFNTGMWMLADDHSSNPYLRKIKTIRI